MLFLVAALLLVPVVELAVMIQVGARIGALETIALLLMVSFVGIWIVKRQGTGSWRSIRRDLDRGVAPGASLVDGALILAAGALFVIPGFVTDALAVLLLVPPVRALVRAVLARRFRVVAGVHGATAAPGSARVYDVDSTERGSDQRRSAPPEITG